jgi:hypothetical protein
MERSVVRSVRRHAGLLVKWRDLSLR